MPAFGIIFTDQQIQSIIDCIRSVQNS